MPVVTFAGDVDFREAREGASYTRGRKIVVCGDCGLLGERRGNKVIHRGLIRGGRFKVLSKCKPGQVVAVGSLIERPNLDVLEVRGLEGDPFDACVLVNLRTGRETRVKLSRVRHNRNEYDVLTGEWYAQARREWDKSPHASWNGEPRG